MIKIGWHRDRDFPARNIFESPSRRLCKSQQMLLSRNACKRQSCSRRHTYQRWIYVSAHRNPCAAL